MKHEPITLLNSESLDDRMIITTRLMLALLALLIIWIDPSEPDQNVAVTYIALILYVIRSALVCLFFYYKQSLFQKLRPWSHWLDVGWYAVLIALSAGTNSLFFYGFYFAILVASFRYGLISGLETTIVSAVVFAIVGLITGYEIGNLELNRFLLRPTALIIVGYMIAFWGGSEIRLKQRLAFVKALTRLSNPRLGSDQLIGSFLERLRVFYQADTCLLVMNDLVSSTYTLRRATIHDPQMAYRAESLAANIAQQLLVLPMKAAVIFQTKSDRRWWQRGPNIYAWEPGRGRFKLDDEAACETIATLLDTASFLTVPFTYHREMSGRLWLTAPRKINHSEIEFLVQVTDQMTPIIQHIRLIDRLASTAAEEERQRIARDIHDSVIQPYIGLQIGLEALQKKIVIGHPKTIVDVESLIELTKVGINDVRHYITGLRDLNGLEQGVLTPLRRFAAKFSVATGIEVQFEFDEEIPVAQRLASEIIQMVIEGLSNIRRHTHSSRAIIELGCQQKLLVLTISNDHSGEPVPPSFKPISITGRAEALGGCVRVEQSAPGLTSVVVEIPL